MSIYITLSAVFALLFYSIYCLISWLHDEKIIANSAFALVKKSKTAEEKRAQIQHELLSRHGKQKETGAALRFDRLIRRSGLRSRIPFLSAGVYVTASVTTALITAFALNALTENLIYSLAAGGSIIAAAFLFLLFCANKNYKRTENALIPFCDIVSNFAATTDDLIAILEKSQPYLSEPISAAVLDCCTAARLTGDTHAALQSLTENVEHEQFGLVIQNLEICSRYICNFAEIIKDCRKMLAEYMAAKKQRAAIVKNARAEMLLLLTLCGFTTSMVSGFVDIGIWTLLTSSAIGFCLIAYCAAVLIAALVLLFSTDKGRA